LPLAIVAHNRIGVINQVLQTLFASSLFGLRVAGIVLNEVLSSDDPSRESNLSEIQRRCPKMDVIRFPTGSEPVQHFVSVAELDRMDWVNLAQNAKIPTWQNGSFSVK
jgi:dethiobiotin synthetase